MATTVTINVTSVDSLSAAAVAAAETATTNATNSKTAALVALGADANYISDTNTLPSSSGAVSGTRGAYVPTGEGKYQLIEWNGSSWVDVIAFNPQTTLNPTSTTEIVTANGIWKRVAQYPFKTNQDIPEGWVSAVKEFSIEGKEFSDNLALRAIKRNDSNLWQIQINDADGAYINWFRSSYTEPALVNGRRYDIIDLLGDNSALILIDWEAIPDGYSATGNVQLSERVLYDKKLRVDFIDDFINYVPDSDITNALSSSNGWTINNPTPVSDFSKTPTNVVTGLASISLTKSSSTPTILASPIIEGIAANETISVGVFVTVSDEELSNVVLQFGTRAFGNLLPQTYNSITIQDDIRFIYVENIAFPNIADPTLQIRSNNGAGVTITISAPTIIKSRAIKPSLYTFQRGNEYNNVIWTSYGDSITALEEWQPFVLKKIPFIHNKRGVGSSSVQNEDYDATITEPIKAWVDATGFLLNRPTKFGGDPDNTTITSNVSVGVTTIAVTDESIFTVGDKVYLYETSGTLNWEEEEVATVSAGQITLTNATVNSYTTTNGAAIDLVPSGGTLISANMCMQERINTIPVNTKLITVFGGANDNGTIGTLADTPAENTTFYAAYKLMLQRIMTRCGNEVRIILCTMPFHEIFDKNNDLNLTYENRRAAIREIGKAFGYPVVDFRELCGWNEINVTTYLADTVHPNEKGGQRMAEVIVPFFNNLKFIN